MTSKKTSILDILGVQDTQDTSDKEVEYENDYERFFDFDNTIESRVDAFINIYNTNRLEAQEIVSDLSASFLFAPIDSIYYIIKELVNVNELDISIRMLLCCCVYNVEEKRHLSFELFTCLLNAMMKNPDTYNSTLFIDLLKYIISTDYKSYDIIADNINILIQFMVNYTSTQDYKYKIYKTFYTLYMENKYHKEPIMYCFKLIKCDCDDKLKIIICSLLYKEKDDVSDLIEELKSIEAGSEIENIKADVADLLLKFEDESAKELGRSILSKLERVKGKRSFYDNSQNVHSIDVDRSIKEFLNFLSTNQSLVVNKFNEEDEFNKISKAIQSINNDERIIQSLNRIYLDSNLYEGYTILTIFLKMWLLINSHTYSSELKQRLVEELIDMSDTCSSGHMLRLTNVFSGYGYNIRMNIKVEIRSKITHLVNKKIKESLESNELIENIGNIEENNKFSLFFMKNSDDIKTELLKEYTLSDNTSEGSPLLDKDEFEEIFRGELVFFETGEQ